MAAVGSAADARIGQSYVGAVFGPRGCPHGRRPALRRDDPARAAEAGYIVAPAARGRGVAGRALAVLTELALNELALERIELRITAENEPSIRVAERCGYVREGVLRSVRFKQGIART